MRTRLRQASVAASVPLVAITAVLWASGLRSPAAEEAEIVRRAQRERLKIWSTPLEDGRCAISVATFGGTRARLVRAEHNGTIHFAVIEAPLKPTPLDILRQGDWLKAKFGVTQTATLGTYATKAAALSTAGRLCPPRLRCLPGRPGCEETPLLPNPMQMYGPSLMQPPPSPSN